MRNVWFITLIPVAIVFSLPFETAALDEITLQLKWLHQVQHAGFYAAARNGLYESEGLAVRFVKGGRRSTPEQRSSEAPPSSVWPVRTS